MPNEKNPFSTTSAVRLFYSASFSFLNPSSFLMPVSVPFLSGHNKLTIELAEPIVYLRGYPGTPTTQVLRGEVVLVTSKPMSASSVMVKFVGRCHSLWPEGK